MSIRLPHEVLNQHVVVLGKTRSGKSSAMRGLVEGLLNRKMPVCIVDPKGDWWGIKLAADGKSPGYPVVIFGGEHADVPINAHSGSHVAELFATGNRPCLIDLGGWMVGERTRFWIDFASSMFRHTKGNRWLVIDEAHNFAPQGKILDPDAGKMLHWSNRLASEGSGKGLILISSSQRPQKVHKDYLTSHETLIAKRVIHPLDRGAMKEWIDGCGDPAKGKEVLDTLAGMPREEGWVWSPEIGFGPKRMNFPMFETYDSFRAQSVQETKGLKGWAEVDLAEVKAKLASVVDEAKANDPKTLKAEIARLKKDLESRPVAKPEIREVPVLQPHERDAIEQLRVMLENVIPKLPAIEDLLSKIRSRHEPTFNGPGPRRILPEVINPSSKVKVPMPDLRILPPPNFPRPDVARPTIGEQKLPVGEKATLIACAQSTDGCDRSQLTVLTGYKRSSRDTYISRLKEKGFVETSFDGLVRATEAGIEALGDDYEPLPTGAALRKYWMDRLPDGECKVLECLITAGPGPGLSREEITAMTGYKRSSRDTYISRMKAKKLIETNGMKIVASTHLFN